MMADLFDLLNVHLAVFVFDQIDDEIVDNVPLNHIKLFENIVNDLLDFHVLYLRHLVFDEL